MRRVAEGDVDGLDPSPIAACPTYGVRRPVVRRRVDVGFLIETLAPEGKRWRFEEGRPGD